MARARIVDPNDEMALEPSAGAAGGTQAPLAPQAEHVLLGDEVPEQYRGKNAKDMLGVAQNQASLIGRQSQEVGQLREEVRRYREMIEARRAPGADDPVAQPTSQPITREDYWDKPQDVVPRVVNESLKQRDQRIERLEYNERRTAFNSTYQTAGQDVNDPDFVAFVEKSPRRKRLASRAFENLQQIDFDAADELWESWYEFKELKGASVATQQPGDQQPKTTPAPVARQNPPPAVRGNGGGADESPSGQPTGKIWTETELLDMQASKPDDYWALAATGEIDRAWREKRVRRQGS